jgi:hypothetical protein
MWGGILAKKGMQPERLNLTLTMEQTQRFNAYVINVAKKRGRIPAKIKTKILRAALEEWLERHENDLDIDWDSKE